MIFLVDLGKYTYFCEDKPEEDMARGGIHHIIIFHTAYLCAKQAY